MTLAGWTAPRVARGGAPARSAVPAAIRIPSRFTPHLRLVWPSASPHLFVHEGARQALERRLRSACPGLVMVSITDNRNTMISHSRKNGVLQVRIHHMFLDAPPRVIDALVQYIASGDRDASDVVGNYIEASSSRLTRRRRRMRLLTQGKHHDLLKILDDVNQRYFKGQMSVLVTWGTAARRKQKKKSPRISINLGSYISLDRLVRIHPVLDRRWVPRYFISFIVYHELLHHALPASRGVGRRNLHPPEFREREQMFRHYVRAVEWERRNLARLLRA
jgi:hypothetical protein